MNELIIPAGYVTTDRAKAVITAVTVAYGFTTYSETREMIERDVFTGSDLECGIIEQHNRATFRFVLDEMEREHILVLVRAFADGHYTGAPARLSGATISITANGLPVAEATDHAHGRSLVGLLSVEVPSVTFELAVIPSADRRPRS